MRQPLTLSRAVRTLISLIPLVIMFIGAGFNEAILVQKQRPDFLDGATYLEMFLTGAGIWWSMARWFVYGLIGLAVSGALFGWLLRHRPEEG